MAVNATPAPECRVEGPAAADSIAAGLLYAAAGFERLRSPDPTAVEAAVICLRAASERLPSSAVVAKDLAAALARQERWDEAQAEIARARRLGAAGPELELLTAVVASARGAPAQARAAATREGSWRGDLVATRYGSSDAKGRLVALLPESTRRAAWGRLVLAMTESGAGDLPAARLLASSAEQQADQLGLSQLAVSARRLDDRLMADASGWQGRLRLRSALEYATNPGFEASSDAPGSVPVRLALTVSGGLSRSFGRLVAFGAIRVDQHLFLNQRDRLGEYDIFQWSLAAGLRYPLSADPNGTVLALVTRFVDVYGDRFGEHLGWMLEGGPELRLRVSGNLQARLAFYGQKTDFIDRSPPDGLLSAVDRDRVGQRAILTFTYDTSRLRASADAMFLRDRATGEAFDAIGGGVGFRLSTRASDRLWLNLGVSGTLREFGPVGDAAVIGAAATRTEFRTVARVGARWRLNERLFALVEDVWVGTAARDRHRYTNNVLSVGMEAVW